MVGLFGLLRRCALPAVAAAAVAAPVGLAPSPAAADSVFFGFSSGGHGGRHHRHHGWRHGPRHHHHSGLALRYSYIAPPPAYYYYPPPRVVYVPPPVVYGPPPIAAAPASPVYQTPSGQYCREYQTSVMVGGRPQPSYGTACLQPDGVWRVVN